MNKKIKERMKIYKGDITKFTNVDAIVCNTNKSLVPIKSGKNSVDYQIHKAAGEELSAECLELRGCGLGKAKITSAYNLKNNLIRNIIHTVGPHYYPMSRTAAREVLTDCYINCLELAKEKDLKSIVFPCIGLGHDGYHHKEQALIAYNTVYKWLEQNYVYNDIDVIFCCYESHDYEIYRSIEQEYDVFENSQVEVGDKEPIGLVLAGGGARGAFELGVWETLCERGIDQYITGISGTSIGAINSALIMSKNPKEKMERFWLEFEQTKLTGDRSQEELLKEIEKATNVWEEYPNFEMDIFTTVVKSPIILKNKYISALNSILNGERYYIPWQNKSAKEIRQLISDSARHQLLYEPREDDKGNIYVDGGTFDFSRRGNLTYFMGEAENSNVPVQPLYDLGYRKFIVVYCAGRAKIQEDIAKESERYGDAMFCRIYPQKPLQDMTHIDKGLTEERIDIGRNAANSQLIDGKHGIEAIRWWDV